MIGDVGDVVGYGEGRRGFLLTRWDVFAWLFQGGWHSDGVCMRRGRQLARQTDMACLRARQTPSHGYAVSVALRLAFNVEQNTVAMSV